MASPRFIIAGLYKSPLGNRCNRWEPRNKDIVLRKILSALQAEQTLHTPRDQNLSLPLFHSSHLAKQRGTITAVTTLLLLMYHCKTTHSSSSHRTHQPRFLFLPRTFTVHGELCVPDIPCVGLGAAGWADQSLFKLLLSTGFGSSCRTGFLLAGPHSKHSTYPKLPTAPMSQCCSWCVGASCQSTFSGEQRSGHSKLPAFLHQNTKFLRNRVRLSE